MSELVRDFDAERQKRYERPRSFKIGGEVFTFHRGLRPEDFNALTDEYFKMTPETPADEAVEVVDKTILGFLEAEADRERWHALRAREKEAITGRDMREVLEMIFEEQTGVPTTLPEPSSNGDESTGESSTENSSSALEDSEVSAV